MHAFMLSLCTRNPNFSLFELRSEALAIFVAIHAGSNLTLLARIDVLCRIVPWRQGAASTQSWISSCLSFDSGADEYQLQISVAVEACGSRCALGFHQREEENLWQAASRSEVLFRLLRV